jgi:hypothetical protein
MTHERQQHHTMVGEQGHNSAVGARVRHIHTHWQSHRDMWRVSLHMAVPQA